MGNNHLNDFEPRNIVVEQINPIQEALEFVKTIHNIIKAIKINEIIFFIEFEFFTKKANDIGKIIFNQAPA